MLDSVKTKLEQLELIAADFKKTSSSQLQFNQEKITDLNISEKLALKYNYILVAMSRNGGLVAICKKKDFFDVDKTKINDNLIVFHQDATTRYSIPLNWDYTEKYIVSIGFNDKEQLFAFCNNGSILKIGIVTQEAKEIITSSRIQDEGINKAKIFEKGYITLTEKGNIYLIKDMKDPNPIFIVSVKQQLGFSNNVDFIGIPSTISNSGNFELIITNEKGNGVLHIEEDTKKEGARTTSFVVYKKEDNTTKKVDVSIIQSEKLEKYVSSNNYSVINGNIYSDNSAFLGETDFNNQNFSQSQNQATIGKINAIAISLSKQKIAFYSGEKNIAYYLSSKIEKSKKLNIEKFKYKPNTEDFFGDEVNEQKAILEYKDINNYQFLFCGEDALAICGQRFILITTKTNETLVFQIIEGREKEAITGTCFFKCIQEVDGIRYITNEQVGLISIISKELSEICDPFAHNPPKILLDSYGNFLSKNPECNTKLKEIGQNLPDAIKNLQIAAANIFWIEKDPDTFNKRDLQTFLLKAAQFGKSFVQKEEFNYDRFIDICKSIRIINEMRNFNLKPRFLTYAEYLDLDPDSPSELINKTIRHLNFSLAFEISNFLGYEPENVYLRYAAANIERLSKNKDPQKELNLYNELISKLKNAPNVSYINLAKKCIKYGMDDIGEKFLQNERSVLGKITQYMQLRRWDKALELSSQNYDWSIIRVVIDKIYRVEEPRKFSEILNGFPELQNSVIDYYISNKKFEDLHNYLVRQKKMEELFFNSLEYFFKSQTIDAREKCLTEAKGYLNNSKNLNYNFYKSYITDLEQSLKFKKRCMDPERNIIASNDITSFDNSIYDCYKKANPENFDWIESQNKKFFEISPKKMMILKFKNLAEKRQVEKIDEYIQKIGIKKLCISPIQVAKILADYNYFDKAAEYAKLETDLEYYLDVFELLVRIDKLLDAVEVVLKNKKNDDGFMNRINDIRKKRPDLRNDIDDLCEKYRVSF